MAHLLKQSTAYTFRLGPFFDSTDGNTQENSLTIAATDVLLSKAGGALAAKNEATALTGTGANAHYTCILNTTDTGTLGTLRVWSHITGALAVWQDFMVLPANVYDSLVAGSDVLDVSATQLAGQVITAAAGVTFPTSIASPTNITAATGIVLSGVTHTGAVIPTVTTVTNQLTAAAIATGVWQDATAGDFTVASSIGKSLYIANVIPGAAGGHFIAGTNAATTITTGLTTTFTGNLTGSVASVTADVGITQAAADKAWSTATRLLTAGTNIVLAKGVGVTGFNDLSAAQVNTEVDTAIADARLDELLAADSDIDGVAPPTVGSVFHELMTKTAGSFTYDQTTDSLEALRDRGDAAWITATGFSTHSAADVWSVVTRALTDKAGFSLTQTFPTNFALLSIDGSGYVTEVNVDGIKKNTALSNFEFLMVDATDGYTEETGLTVTATRSIDGAAFGACANAVTEVASGIYKINLAAADLNGDVITLRFTATGARTRLITLKTNT